MIYVGLAMFDVSPNTMEEKMVHHLSCLGLKRTQHHLFHMSAPHMTIGSIVHKRSILAHAVPTVPQHHLFHMTAICCSCNCHRIDKLEGRVAKLEHENAKLVNVLIQAPSAPSSPATEDTVPPRTAANFKLPVAQHTHVSCSASNDTANTYATTTIRWLHGASYQSCRPPTSPSVVDDEADILAQIDQLILQFWDRDICTGIHKKRTPVTVTWYFPAECQSSPLRSGRVILGA